jgi:hypothetical protein
MAKDRALYIHQAKYDKAALKKHDFAARVASGDIRGKR